MRTVNIHEAKTHLSRLIEDAMGGNPFIIAKAGKPMVTVSAIEPQQAPKAQAVGFLDGQFDIPDDFDTMFQDDIERLFHGEEE